MLQLALAGQPNFQVDLIEKDRPGPSFTVDTLGDLNRLHPGNEFFLILGADCLPDFHTWREPVQILAMATLLVAPRPGTDEWTPMHLAQSLCLSDAGQVRVQPIDMPFIEISSRDLRARAAAGRSLLYMVPRAVEVYIREKHVYR
jgi:nicotinate-nucleotide adenylyltransferase